MFRILLSIGFVPYCVFCANILYINSVPSPSHQIWYEEVVRALLQNGHNVTLIGYFDAKFQSPNYTVLKIDFTNCDFGLDNHIQGENSPISELRMFWQLTPIFTDIVYESPTLKTLLDYPKNAFDLIIYDVARMHLYPLIEYFENPPVVAVSVFGLPPFILKMMGAEFHSYYPIWASAYSDQMTFWQRLINYGLYITDYVLEYHSNLRVEEKAKERFGPNIMSLAQVQKKFNVLLANYDPILDLPQPLPPHIIPVGGLHVKRPTELSEDLRRILDDSKDGVIFFSFGTNVQWSWLPDEIKKAFLSAFSKMKQTILWKCDQEDLENVPKNVVIKKWFPQSSILSISSNMHKCHVCLTPNVIYISGHQNVKLFITHGGALSVHEAVYHGVPVLGIPFFMDQRNNVVKMEAKMVGKRLQLSTITEDVLEMSISEIINNSIYSKRMRKYSEAYRSRKETSIEAAMFWIELVLKQKNLSYLWPKSRDMNFWERQNLDIFLFVSLVLISIFFVSFKLVTWTITKIFPGKFQQKIKIS